MVKLKKKKKISIEEAERITGGLDLWGQTENFTPPKHKVGKDGKIHSDDLPKLPFVTAQQIHHGKKYDYVIHYPDGKAEGVNVKSKFDKAKIDLQLSLDSIRADTAVKGMTLGNTTQAMKLLKRWRDQMEGIKDTLVPKGLREFDEQYRKTQKIFQNEQKALTGIMGLKILEKFYDKPKSITTKPITGGTILTGGYVSSVTGKFVPPYKPKTIRPPKPQAHAREPLTGAGMRRFMELMKIDNPVLIAKKYPKNQKALSISGFINLRFLCESMNVSVEEAFLYICEGMQRTNKRWLSHRIEKEFFRGSNSIESLVKYFYEKCEHNKKKHIGKYTLKQLFASEYFNNFCKLNGIEFKSYTDFTRHFKTWKHHVDVLIINKPKGLLN